MGFQYSVPSSSTPRQPRYRPRYVPLDVLVLGLPRTGTASLKQALKELGYKHPYHFDSVMTDFRGDCGKWVKAMSAKYEGSGWLFRKREWDDLLGSSQAVSDIPCIIFYRELLRTYPDAKVILTIRSSSKEWADSYRETVRAWFGQLYNDRSAGARLRHLFGIKTSFEKMCQMIDQHFLQVIDEDPEKFYEAWVSKIKHLAGPDRLLVFDVHAGYEPLYRFLEIHNPRATQFPHLNGRANFPAYFSVSQTEPPQTAGREGEASQTEAYDFRGAQSE